MRSSRASAGFFLRYRAATLVAAIGSLHCGGGSFERLSGDAGANGRLDAAEDNPAIGVDVIQLIDASSAADSSSLPDSSGVPDLSSAPDSGSGSEGGASCLIDGTPYTSGASNPTNACQSCVPVASTSAWTDASDGTSCGSGGMICHLGACASGCEIGDLYYAAMGVNPNDSCQSCQPLASTSAWTNLMDGTGCGNGQICSSGACGAQCDIGGTIVATGTVNQANACQSCQPGASISAWTTLAAGTGCGSGQVCNGATCSSGCFIAGAFYASNAVNPADPCETCTGSNTTSWTSVDGANASCPTGEVCNGNPASCVSGCWIGGAFYAPNAANPADPCETCVAGATTWTGTEGANASCPTGDVCYGNPASCVSGCWIGGTFYAPNAANPADPCETCVAGATTWTSTEGANATCPTGEVCNGSPASCAAGCWIGGAFYAPNAVNQGDPCETCVPTSSTTSWTSTDGANAGCPAGDVCNGSPASCASGCWIDGAYYATGAVNPSDACQGCVPGTSTSAWSTLGDGTMCGSGETCESGACGTTCVLTITSYYESGTYGSPLLVSYQVVGGAGGGSQTAQGPAPAIGGPGGGGETLVKDTSGNIDASSPGGNGGSSATWTTGTFPLPAMTALFGYVGGGGGGGGASPLGDSAGGGGGVGYQGGGGGAGACENFPPAGEPGGGGGATGDGAGGEDCGPPGSNGSYAMGGNGGYYGSSDYPGLGGNGYAGGQGGPVGGGGGGGGWGGGGGVAGFGSQFAAGNGGNTGANGGGNATGKGGLGATNWSTATSMSQTTAGQLQSGITGGNAGLIILTYFVPGNTCPLGTP